MLFANAEQAPSGSAGVRRTASGALNGLARWIGALRTPEFDRAFQSIFVGLGRDALCLCAGGGLGRFHPALVNVNLGPFGQVDVAAEIYRLPYADESVDAVRIETAAPLEYPAAAVREIHRVLRPKGRVFAAAPLLEDDEEDPLRLFEREGLYILEAGPRASPVSVLRDRGAHVLRKILPGRPSQIAEALLDAAARSLQSSSLPLYIVAEK